MSAAGKRPSALAVGQRVWCGGAVQRPGVVAGFGGLVGGEPSLVVVRLDDGAQRCLARAAVGPAPNVADLRAARDAD